MSLQPVEGEKSLFILQEVIASPIKDGQTIWLLYVYFPAHQGPLGKPGVLISETASLNSPLSSPL